MVDVCNFEWKENFIQKYYIFRYFLQLQDVHWAAKDYFLWLHAKSVLIYVFLIFEKSAKTFVETAQRWILRSIFFKKSNASLQNLYEVDFVSPWSLRHRDS